MLFLVVSDPAPTVPREVAVKRRAFWDWLAPYRTHGTVRFCYPRAGRGAVALFDVPSNEALHRLLTEWSNLIPAQFAIYPLVEESAARSLLDT